MVFNLEDLNSEAEQFFFRNIKTLNIRDAEDVYTMLIHWLNKTVPIIISKSDFKFSDIKLKNLVSSHRHQMKEAMICKEGHVTLTKFVNFDLVYLKTNPDLNGAFE